MCPSTVQSSSNVASPPISSPHFSLCLCPLSAAKAHRPPSAVSPKVLSSTWSWDSQVIPGSSRVILHWLQATGSWRAGQGPLTGPSTFHWSLKHLPGPANVGTFCLVISRSSGHTGLTGVAAEAVSFVVHPRSTMHNLVIVLYQLVQSSSKLPLQLLQCLEPRESRVCSWCAWQTLSHRVCG